MCCDEMAKAAFGAMVDRGLTEAKAGNYPDTANVFADSRQEVPNKTTAAAIAEGKAIAFDDKKKGFSSMCDLKGALNE